MKVAYLGVDIAKNVFQLCGMSRAGNVVLTKRIQRDNLNKFVAQIPACIVGLEACAGAYYWHSQFEAMGHTVKIISPQFVKPFVKGQKNDDPASFPRTPTYAALSFASASIGDRNPIDE